MGIPENISKVKETLGDGCLLIVVSKNQELDKIQEAYNCGQRVFGENRVQELTMKYEQLPKDIEWHLIGHLQTNKVKYIAPFVSLVHSVESLKLLEEINKQAAKSKRVIDCLLQIFIAKEETKFGLSRDEAFGIINSIEIKELKNIKIVGIMGMATNTDNMAIVRDEFHSLKKLFDELSKFQAFNIGFKHISMGMSNDFELAKQEGSTMVRVGSAIFNP